MTSKGSANEALRGNRANDPNNGETGSRNDMKTMILANGSSYDLKERVVLRSLSLEMRVAVGRRQGCQRGTADTGHDTDQAISNVGCLLK